eukprot:CFRG4006T1
MLEFASISTKGGCVLWSYKPTLSSLHNSTELLNSLIGDVLVEGRGASNKEYNFKNNYTVAYALDNANDLLTVIVAQKSIFPMLGYIDDILQQVPTAFRKSFKKYLDSLKSDCADVEVESTSVDQNLATHFRTFDDTFDAILKKNVGRAETRKKVPPKMKKFDEGAKAQRLREKALELAVETIKDADDGTGKPISVEQARADFLAARRGGKKSPKARSPIPSGGECPIGDGVSSLAAPKTKEKRNWDGGVGNKKGPKLSELDRSTQLTDKQMQKVQEEEVEKLLEGVDIEGGADISFIGEGLDQEDSSDEDEASPTSKGFFSNFFDGITGNKEITKDVLNGALNQYREHLVDKNVANDVATELCTGIEESLIGTKMSTLKGVKKIVKDSLQASLSRILSSNRRIDIIRDIELANTGAGGGGQRPYVIAFCGVNGVGKSTNLAKVCYWLLHNNLTVTIAACDTFRAGAVEQLRVHQSALRQTIKDPSQIELFDQGYGKDAAGVASDAIKQASAMCRNVVLVDTAGRMQNNVPLMRSLAKLVNVNKPDLLLFVGEALVGNEAVDQLSKFNEALTDFSPTETPRLIDGMILTKFDTIDDKVGAAVSMTYTTGKPVIFVGTGQTYRDLKKLDIPTIVSTLLT